MIPPKEKVRYLSSPDETLRLTGIAPGQNSGKSITTPKEQDMDESLR